MSVRERLNLLIKDRGMTQIALARRLGPDSSWDDWVGDRLRGRTQIKADELPMLATALGVHPCFLLTGDEIAPTPSREDREKTTDDDALLDLDAERLYRRYRRVFEEHAEELQSYMDYLDWKREQQG